MFNKFLQPIHRTRPFLFIFAILFIVVSVAVSACTSATPSTPVQDTAAPASDGSNESDSSAVSVIEVGDETAVPTSPPVPTVPPTIIFDITAEPISVDQRVLGTNLPAWLGAGLVENETFISETIASGVSVIRIPGGSWSNAYNWLACETGVDINGNEEACWSWPWGLRPTDFINFIKATDTEAMYTVSHNGSAKSAAALVAFFNGSVDDDTLIGVDVYGSDWGKVSDWATLRSENGNPEPANVKYWEIGNEIYGGKAGSGTDCLDWGWEDVWTCDGTEYVLGIGEGSTREEGFLEFFAEMKKVDPTILIGAVGIPFGNSRDYWVNWNNWGNEVIAAAGDVMDFYIIHQYGYLEQPEDFTDALEQPQAVWQPIMADLELSFDEHVAGRRVPIAVTEYNLFSVEDMDNEQWMTRAVNMLFMADTLGQMMQNGVTMANQWDLANIPAWNGTDYGMIHANTNERYPQYYAFVLWSQFGEMMFPVQSDYAADSELSVYAGMADSKTVSIYAINKTDAPIEAAILIQGVIEQFAGGTAVVVQADSLDSQTVTFNGIEDTAVDFSNAPPLQLKSPHNPLLYQFEPYSITLLQIELSK